MTVVRGKVVRIKARFCFLEPLNPRPEEYERSYNQRLDIFLHEDYNDGKLPQFGDVGEFEVGPGKLPGQAAVIKVLMWEPKQTKAPLHTSQYNNPQKKKPHQQSPTSHHGGGSHSYGGDRPQRPTFIHPYNFVPLPADGLGEAANIPPFKRASSPTHDRYERGLCSGYVDCSITTKTHWFIPHPEKCKPDREHKDHKWLGYFTLDPVNKAWKPEIPAEDTTEPAIPASSIRGIVRNVFETATLSCLGVFDYSILDFRLGYSPDYLDNTSNPARRIWPKHGEAWPDYVPVRLVRHNSEWGIQALGGREPPNLRIGEEHEKLLPVALIKTYNPQVFKQNQAGRQLNVLPNEMRNGSRESITDGTAVAVLITRRIQEYRSYQKGVLVLKFRYRQARRVVLAHQWPKLSGDIDHEHALIFGYLHRTGPNIEKKKHERIFFRWGSYNGFDYPGTPEQRYQEFLKDQESEFDLPIEDEVFQNTVQSLKGYADRHGRDLVKLDSAPRELKDRPKPPYPSDFVQPHAGDVKELKHGDLFYALIASSNDGAEVRGLYPVAMPRLSHDDDRGALLHKNFHPCDEPDELCPACRVFGWVRGGEDFGKGQDEVEQDRSDAVASHVRFTHGLLRGEWDRDRREQVKAIPLAILGGPKPTTTAFYLSPRQNFSSSREGRWPPFLRADRVIKKTIPLYRREEANLQGRKMYRRRQDVKPSEQEPSMSGLKRIPNNKGETRDSQNQTIHLLLPSMTFGFRVFFDNLTKRELGALLFALTLQAPKNGFPKEAQEELFHQVGHGKPLGMGRCSIQVERLEIDSFDGPSHRYASLGSFEPLSSLDQQMANDEPSRLQDVSKRVDLLIAKLGEAWSELRQKDSKMGAVIDELVEMLRIAPDGNVHYPPNPEGQFVDNYKWFMRNKSRGGYLLPSPKDERDSRKRLPIDPSS
jgi:CRISPR-associated protein (TIGR03986 family)